MRVVAIFLLLFTTTFTLEASKIFDRVDSVSFSAGVSHDDINVFRVSLRDNFETKWLKSDFSYLSGYYELSANYMSKDSDSNFGIALSPVFTYNINVGDMVVYAEAGIGASFWSSTTISWRDLSSHFLFEDRIGAGVRYGNYDFSFRYMHYSNAGIVKPNHGIDIFIASVSYQF